MQIHKDGYSYVYNSDHPSGDYTWLKLNVPTMSSNATENHMKDHCKQKQAINAEMLYQPT